MRNSSHWVVGKIGWHAQDIAAEDCDRCGNPFDDGESCWFDERNGLVACSKRCMGKLESGGGLEDE